MATKPSKPVVITLPDEIGRQIETLARQQQRSSNDVVCDACRQHLAAAHPTDLDDRYERGYRMTPETTEDLNALLPHLPVPQESWE